MSNKKMVVLGLYVLGLLWLIGHRFDAIEDEVQHLREDYFDFKASVQMTERKEDGRCFVNFW